TDLPVLLLHLLREERRLSGLPQCPCVHRRTTVRSLTATRNAKMSRLLCALIQVIDPVGMAPPGPASFTLDRPGSDPSRNARASRDTSHGRWNGIREKRSRPSTRTTSLHRDCVWMRLPHCSATESHVTIVRGGR